MNRRDFLMGATLGGIGLGALGEGVSLAQASGQGPKAPELDDELKGRQVNVAVIGMGPRGKEILTALSRMTDKFVKISYVCDTFAAPVFVKKAQAIAPAAKFVQDYKIILDDKSVEAVFIATPSHKHKQVSLDAIAAGKHVYCEAPLAHSVEEARAIALAANAAKTIFHPGLHQRCNAQALHVRDFVEGGNAGTMTGMRAQYHDRKSWRFGHPDAVRQDELNWRLSKDVSPGMFGEIAIHQIDTASWYLNSLPKAVTAHGSVGGYKDGREVHDTVSALIEYPNGVNLSYEATLTNSFDGAYEMFYGTESAIMLRDLRGWMFRESDAALIGWVVFARNDSMKIGAPEANTGLLVGTGVALVANATKQLALGKEPGKVGTDVSKSALYLSARVFLNSVREGAVAFAKEPTSNHPKPPRAPRVIDGLQATIVALKANESAQTGTRIELKPEWFTI